MNNDKKITGCTFRNEKKEIKHCKYFSGSHCTHDNGAILTSTLFGAHPADCPLLKEGCK